MKIFKGKYEPKLPEAMGRGGGVQTKKPSLMGECIFSGTTQFPGAEIPPPPHPGA